MSAEISINPCKLAGCDAACCQDMEFFNISREQQNLSFPQATYVDNDEYIETLPDGVYYSESENKIVINGKCPHLEDSGNCGIFGQPQRPPNCLEFGQGTSDCFRTRLIAGHKFPVELVEQFNADPTLVIF